MNLTVATNLEITRFEVFRAVTMNSAVFWNVTSCGSRYEEILFLHSMLVASYGVHCSLFIDSCHPNDGDAIFLQTSVLTRATWHNISEDGIPEIT
jgi:hypothetical protein